MSRRTEGVLLVAAAALAWFGITLVELAGGGTPTSATTLTFLMVAVAFLSVHLAVRRFAPHATTLLLPPVALVAAIGLVEIRRLSPYRAGLQSWWLLIASGAAVLTLWALRRHGVTLLRRYRYLLMLVTTGLLLLPLLPSEGPLPIRGVEVNGSRLWIHLDLVVTTLSFQPGEVAKVAFVAFLAGYLADRQPALTGAHRRWGRVRIPEPRQLLPVLVVWLGSMLVLVFQRDLGASLLLFAVFVALLYAATGENGYLLAGALLMGGGAVASWQAFSHVQRRVEAWLTPFADYEGAGYQISQGLFALGTGSLSGSGPGLGRPDLIPNAITDFIFAAVAEELGFAGSVAVLAAYALMVAVAFGIALRARDLFRKLLAAGLGFALGMQTFLILGGVLRLVPLTGIALPFMSYGGSSLVGNFLLVALLLRVSHEERV